VRGRGHSCPPFLILIFVAQEFNRAWTEETFCGASLRRAAEGGCPHVCGLSLLKFPITKVAGKLIANFLRPAYCQCGEVYPSILTESRPAGLVMAVTDF